MISERSKLKQFVDIIFIDYGNEDRGVYVDDVFRLPLSDPSLGPLLDPQRNPGYAVGPYSPVAGRGGRQVDRRISVSVSSYLRRPKTLFLSHKANGISCMCTRL